MVQIEDILVRKILDSRGNATVEADVITTEGFGRAAAPSGASTGAHEVRAWPKGGVDRAVQTAREEVLPSLKGANSLDQRGVDQRLLDVDGTPDFGHIGGNLAVAVSLAVAKAAAHSLDLPLYAYLGGAFVDETPKPMGNVLGGGAHAVGGTDIQEYLAVALSGSALENVRANAWTHKRVKQLLKERFPDIALGKGDEGAWVAPMGNEEALELVSQACGEAGDEFGFAVRPALDVAASELYEDGVYRYKDGERSSAEQVDFIAGLVEDYNLYSVEDGLDEDDWDAWVDLTDRVGDRCLLVGDDLFVTNPERLSQGIDMGAANAILVKPNQIGTLTRTIDTIKLAHRNGYATVISHRSGETADVSIAHLGVAFGCVCIKTGAVGGERTAKLNELIRIEEEL